MTTALDPWAQLYQIGLDQWEDPTDPNLVSILRAYYQQPLNFPQFAVDRLPVKHKNPALGLVPFALKPGQQLVWDEIARQIELGIPVRLTVLKCRQPGISSLCMALAYWLASMRPFTRCLSMAHDDDTSKTLFQTIRLFHEEITQAFSPSTRSYRNDGLDFESKDDDEENLRSSISVMTAGSPGVGIGRTTHLLHMSECARYEYAEDLITGAAQAVPTQPMTFQIKESTAQPGSVWFRGECERAKAGESNDGYVFCPWQIEPEYSMAVPPGWAPSREEQELCDEYGLTYGNLIFRRYKINEFDGITTQTGVSGEEYFAQEYPMNDVECWRTIGACVFRKHLPYLHSGVQRPLMVGNIGPGPRVFEDAGDANDGGPPLAIWEQPEAREQYYIGADVALEGDEGDDNDYSVAHVIKRSTHEQVAEWHGHVDPFEFASVLSMLGHYYNRAIVAVEVTGPGIATNMQLMRTYPYLYRWRHRDTIKRQITDKTGWQTTESSRRYVIGLMQSAMKKRAVVIRSLRLYNQIEHFVWTSSTRCEADAGWHDDCVFAWMIAYVNLDDESAAYGETTVSSPMAVEREQPAQKGLTQPWRQNVAAYERRKRGNRRRARSFLGV